MKLRLRPPTETVAAALGWKDQRARRERFVPGEFEESYTDGYRLAARLEREGVRRAWNKAIDEQVRDSGSLTPAVGSPAAGGFSRDCSQRSGPQVGPDVEAAADAGGDVLRPDRCEESRFAEVSVAGGYGLRKPLERRPLLLTRRAATESLSESEGCTKGSVVRKAIAPNASRRELGSVDPFLPMSGRIDDERRRCGSGDPVYPQSPEAGRDDTGRHALGIPSSPAAAVSETTLPRHSTSPAGLPQVPGQRREGMRSSLPSDGPSQAGTVLSLSRPGAVPPFFEVSRG